MVRLCIYDKPTQLDEFSDKHLEHMHEQTLRTR